MKNLVRVHERNSLDHLEHYALHCIWAQAVWTVINVLQHGALNVLEHETDTVFIAKYMSEVHDVVVLELFQDSDFSKCSFTNLRA